MSKKKLLSWLGLSISLIIFSSAGCNSNEIVEENNNSIAGAKADKKSSIPPAKLVTMQIPFTASCYPPYNPEMWDCCFMVNNATGHNYCSAMPLKVEYAVTSDSLADLEKKYRNIGKGELIMKNFQPNQSINVSCTDIVPIDENSEETAVDCHMDTDTVQVPEGMNLLVRVSYDYGAQSLEDILAGNAYNIRNSNVFYIEGNQNQ